MPIMSEAIFIPVTPEERGRALKKFSLLPERTRKIAALTGTDPIKTLVLAERKENETLVALSALAKLSPDERKILRTLHGTDPLVQAAALAKSQALAKERAAADALKERW